jgi:hypothetical protein
MDEKFRGKGMWIGLGAVAIVFLCLMLIGFAAVAAFAPHLGPIYGVAPQVQPPAGSEGGAVPAPYYGYAPLRGGAGFGLFGILGFGIGLIFKLLFFGLLLLLFFRLIRHLLWGPRHWGYRHWGPCWGAKPPEGKEGQGPSGATPGPWAWPHHRHWGPPPWWAPESGPAPETGKPDTAESEYTGPQE